MKTRSKDAAAKAITAALAICQSAGFSPAVLNALLHAKMLADRERFGSHRAAKKGRAA